MRLGRPQSWSGAREEVKILDPSRTVVRPKTSMKEYYQNKIFTDAAVSKCDH
jgi:hypothetical protein